MNKVRKILTTSGFKITPQRIAVLQALHELKNHPTADDIIAHVHQHSPHIAVGTIYKTLEAFAEKGIVKKVLIEKDRLRYDFITQKHHHLYDTNTEQVQDYFDDELNSMIAQYFESKNIPNFNIQEVKLQIIGQFVKPE